MSQLQAEISVAESAKSYRFNPVCSVVARVKGLATIAELQDEQGVYSASPEFIRRHGGPLAQSLLDSVPPWYYQEADRLGLFPNCDVRIHRLYPGDFPAYPGWHCDGEFRETYFSQPDMDRIQVHKHLICTISTHDDGVSNTQFLMAPFTAEVDDGCTDVTLWGQVHNQVERQRHRSVWDTSDGELVCFDSWTLHRCMPAKIRGWRLFFRMSMWHKPNLGQGGMLTKQEQVYRLSEGGGW